MSYAIIMPLVSSAIWKKLYFIIQVMMSDGMKNKIYVTWNKMLSIKRDLIIWRVIICSDTFFLYMYHFNI